MLSCLSDGTLGRAMFGLVCLSLMACRAPLRLSDLSTPRCVTFAIAPEVADSIGLRADLEAAFQPQWRVLTEDSEPPPDQILLKVRVTHLVLGSSSSKGNGLLFSGGLILGVGALAMSHASGWDTLAWIPIGGVSGPLLITGLVQKIKTVVLDSRRGYPLPSFRVNLWLVVQGKVIPANAFLDAQDLREFAHPLDAARARDPRQVRRALMLALAQYVGEHSGLESVKPVADH